MPRSKALVAVICLIRCGFFQFCQNNVPPTDSFCHMRCTVHKPIKQELQKSTLL
nr:MAG TPA: hypothetical protein [Caudoviricetes sp.]